MRVLEHERKVQIINCLCNGMSLRATSRITNTHRTAIQRLLVQVGQHCERMMLEKMRGIDCRYLELDEIWTFVGKKERMLTPAEKFDPGLGDQYLFFGIDRETKLVPAWELGKRTTGSALRFLRKLKGSLNGCRSQVSTDAWPGYEDAMEQVFGSDVDYAQLTKVYETQDSGRGRYAPPKVTETISNIITGNPNQDMICTSIVERSNLTVRTMQRRFTRLALGFSKKLENLRAAVALHFAYYNFVWIPRTLRVTPAMAAGVADRLWEVEDLVKG